MFEEPRKPDFLGAEWVEMSVVVGLLRKSELKSDNKAFALNSFKNEILSEMWLIRKVN